MTRRGLLPLTLGVLLGSQALAGQAPLGLDGHHSPPTTEGSYSFDCGNIFARVRYRQERLPPESVDSLERSLRVTLLELSVSGRSVSTADLEVGRDLFRSFAWVHRVDATCYAGRVTINISGMPLQPFIASLNNPAAGDMPDLQTRTIRLSTTGIVHTS